MTRTIWEQPLFIRDEPQVVEWPAGAEIVACQMTPGEQLCLWYLHAGAEERQARTFLVYGTGHPIQGGPLEHVGTVQQGPFVWHVFEVRP